MSATLPLPDGLTWYNVERPLTADDLRQRVVLLAFWTMDQPASLALEAQLRRVDAAEDPRLAVIRVHVPLLPAQRDREAVRRSMLAMGLQNPVVLDRDGAMTKAWSVTHSPEVLLLSADGYPMGRAHTPVQLEALLAEAQGQVGILKGTPALLPLRPEEDISDPELIFAPTRVVPGQGNDVWLADAGNHRLLRLEIDFATLTGFIREVVGGPQRGFEDGGYGAARFDTPQGLALSPDGTYLYVADAANNAVRQVHLADKVVATVLGTGAWPRELAQEPANGRATALAWPMDVLCLEDMVYVAAAGEHRLWSFDATTGWAAPEAGTGLAGLEDGEPAAALFNIPSGLAWDGAALYVTDARTGAVRRVVLGPEGSVTTLAGGTPGDADGDGPAAQLQWPQAISWSSEHKRLLVADAYNHKIKVLNPEAGACRGVAGKGRGSMDGPSARFFEPTGAAVALPILYVVDRGNNHLRYLHLESGRTETIRIVQR